MQYSNLHTHTCFSDGHNTVEETVLEAIKRGMVSVGISDHSYTPCDLRYCMRPMNMDGYIREVRRVQQKYAGQIEVYLGIEYDGFSDLEHRESFDYLIGACHNLKIGNTYVSVHKTKEEQQAAVEQFFDGDTVAYAKAYFETYVACTKKHRPDILAHFDLATKFSYVDDLHPVYKNAAVEALLACMESTSLLEVNTGSVIIGQRPFPYPAEFLLEEWHKHGGRIILASDSHDNLDLTGCFADTLVWLKNIGYNSIVVLKGGKFNEVGIS